MHEPAPSPSELPKLTLLSPSGVVLPPGKLTRAAKRLSGLGFAVEIDESARARVQRFAGDDDTRLQAIHRVADQSPQVALASRGGYGMTRLLDRLDWSRVAASVARGTAWVGHSDFTALHLAALAHGAGGDKRPGEGVSAGLWAGPMACDDFGRDDVPGGGDDVTQACFVEAMTGELEAVGFRVEPGRRGAATQVFDGLSCKGVLWGGNLSMLVSMLGTPHFPRIRGGILFLEDVNEHPYRIERALLQLHQAGVLAQQRAVLLGAFTAFKPSPLDRGYKLDAAIAHLRQVCHVPLITGLPFGHVATKVCLPLGREVELVVQGRDALLMW